MRVRELHPWDLSPKEAMRLQTQLASQVVREGAPDPERVRYIAGGDVAFDKPHNRAVGVVAVLAYPSLEVVERVSVETPVMFPYVPGLLSFREIPVLSGAFSRIETAPDIVMADGHGYAHPRRFGFACHLGLLLDVPTIGIAKSVLVGGHAGVGVKRGSRSDLVHDGDVIGAALRTRDGVRPIYVSVGHRIALAAAERWALACAPSYRVPEPTRIADRYAGEMKRRMLELTLEMVIEQRAGEPGRWEWEADRDAVVYRHDLPPMLTHYGCSTSLISPGDGEWLDIMLVDDRERARGERLDVRVIDVLERSDGDHKLLALPTDIDVASMDHRLAHLRDEIFAWYVALEKPVTRWAGEEGALAAIRDCVGTTENRQQRTEGDEGRRNREPGT
jgi:deoxyribonuclease V